MVSSKIIDPGFNSFGCGVDAGNRLLSQQNPPTAIFAANDAMAAGGLSVAHDHGLNVPGDLSVVGFDDIPIATESWPPLTTIVQPTRQMAKRATSLLLDIVSGNTPSPQDVVAEIPSSLVHRQSTAKPAIVRT